MWKTSSVTMYNVTLCAHNLVEMYVIMQSVYKLVVNNHMNLVRTHHLDPTCLVCYVHMSRRDYHDMTPRNPICMMHRNRS